MLSYILFNSDQAQHEADGQLIFKHLITGRLSTEISALVKICHTKQISEKSRMQQTHVTKKTECTNGFARDKNETKKKTSDQLVSPKHSSAGLTGLVQ